MQPSRPSIWLHDSNETASRKPGALQKSPIIREQRAIERLYPQAGQTRPRGQTIDSSSLRHRFSSENAATMSSTVSIPARNLFAHSDMPVSDQRDPQNLVISVFTQAIAVFG